jgi:solute carrier family 13 (sodium-dependent dicarboxylate transporter), member 2/3/5
MADHRMDKSQSIFSRNSLLSRLPFWTGIILFSVLMFANPFQLDAPASRVVAVAVLMITWWITEALPMPVVALLPLILFPLLGISTIGETAAPYANEVIFLFMGGFMIGLAIEKWNLHKRIALNIVRVTGTSGNRIILGFILATGFLSMWLSNTATTMMMFPIALSVISVVKSGDIPEKSAANFSLCIMLAIAYASNFGGIATIIGTPPNVAYASFVNKKYGIDLAFSDWMLVCMPISLLLMFSLYVVMVKWLYPNHIRPNEDMKDMIHRELSALGKLRKPEKRVLFVFVLTALLWITRDLVNQLKWFRLDDNMIAVFGAVLLFIIPAGVTEKGSGKILEWKDTGSMAWGILLLFGGGITLAAALEKAGLITMLGKWIAGFSGSNLLLIVIVVTALSIFISEVMSNIAQVIVMAPVVSGIADAVGINPFMLGIPMTLAASAASMMPMGTPPNAIVFASGHIRMKQMIKTGLVMNIISIVLIVLFSVLVLPYVMTLAGNVR